METLTRRPLEGLTNILKFNCHFFALASGLVLMLSLSLAWQPIPLAYLSLALIGFVLLGTGLSLGASFFIYDYSGFYSLNWLEIPDGMSPDTIVNVHAGFDETSRALSAKFPTARLQVLDFYDPARHTEVSIKRARKAVSPYPGTLTVTTNQLPIKPESSDLIFAIFGAHEIRDQEERIAFFSNLRSSLKPGGRIIVVEHLRDFPNFLVYNFGFFHFLSKASWLKTYRAAGLEIKSEVKLNPFISVFYLQKNGDPS